MCIGFENALTANGNGHSAVGWAFGHDIFQYQETLLRVAEGTAAHDAPSGQEQEQEDGSWDGFLRHDRCPRPGEGGGQPNGQCDGAQDAWNGQPRGNHDFNGQQSESQQDQHNFPPSGQADQDGNTDQEDPAQHGDQTKDGRARNKRFQSHAQQQERDQSQLHRPTGQESPQLLGGAQFIQRDFRPSVVAGQIVFVGNDVANQAERTAFLGFQGQQSVRRRDLSHQFPLVLVFGAKELAGSGQQ